MDMAGSVRRRRGPPAGKKQNGMKAVVEVRCVCVCERERERERKSQKIMIK